MPRRKGNNTHTHSQNLFVSTALARPFRTNTALPSRFLQRFRELLIRSTSCLSLSLSTSSLRARQKVVISFFGALLAVGLSLSSLGLAVANRSHTSSSSPLSRYQHWRWAWEHHFFLVSVWARLIQFFPPVKDTTAVSSSLDKGSLDTPPHRHHRTSSA